jgi:hypothetical protein
VIHDISVHTLPVVGPLNLIFGEQAANVLETAIVQKLLTSLGIDLRTKLTLAEAIVIVKA